MKFHYTTKKYLYTAAKLTVLFCSLCTGFGQVTFQGLGHLPNYTDSYASAVSGTSSVVVGYSTDADGKTEAFRWTATGGMQGLGVLVADGVSDAQGVSADGSVVVGGASTSDTVVAIQWTATGDHAIGSLGETGSSYTHAVGVSANGNIVVGTYSMSGGEQAFRWVKVLARGFHMKSLGGLVKHRDSFAYGINANGDVVIGRASNADHNTEAFRWTAAAGMQGLGDLPGGDFSSYATAVNAGGDVVVGGGTSAAGFEAFRWTAATGMRGLGDLPGGNFDSEAKAVNASGSIVVGYGTSSDGYKAMVWTNTTGMLSIPTLLQAAGIDLTGWNLQSANGISSDGQVIVGNGTHNGKTEAWILTGVDQLISLRHTPPLAP